MIKNEDPVLEKDYLFQRPSKDTAGQIEKKMNTNYNNSQKLQRIITH